MGSSTLEQTWLSLKPLLLQGQRRALSRAISLLENEPGKASAWLHNLGQRSQKAMVIGITGAPGVGKSTLTTALVSEFLKDNKRVGIIAIDPSSPYSGGAILGDRVRMMAFGEDSRVFLRSLASRGEVGGLAQVAAGAVELLDILAWEVIIIETVGSGQAEVDIAKIADTVLVVCTPGLGDDIQALKAGILEIAHLLVVNKADLPLAKGTIRHLEEAVRLRPEGRNRVVVFPTVAAKGEGIATLRTAIETHQKNLSSHNRGQVRRQHERLLLEKELLRWVREKVARLDDKRLGALSQAFREDELSIEALWAELTPPPAP